MVLKVKCRREENRGIEHGGGWCRIHIGKVKGIHARIDVEDTGNRGFEVMEIWSYGRRCEAISHGDLLRDPGNVHFVVCMFVVCLEAKLGASLWIRRGCYGLAYLSIYTLKILRKIARWLSSRSSFLLSNLFDPLNDQVLATMNSLHVQDLNMRHYLRSKCVELP